MQDQSRDQDKRKGTPGSAQQQPQQDRSRDQKKGRTTGNQSENDQDQDVVNQEDQQENPNRSSQGTTKPGTGKERSFYKNDLPENEKDTDVDERSRNTQP